jgi:hypothetical protein
LKQCVQVALGVGPHVPNSGSGRLGAMTFIWRFPIHHVAVDKRNVVPYKMEGRSVYPL